MNPKYSRFALAKARRVLRTLLPALLIFTSNSYTQQEAYPIDTLKPQEERQRYDYRRIDPNNLPPIEKYAQPKEQVFPLGYGTKTLGKITSGTGVWTELNPKVPRVTYLGLHFVNKDTGWACGQSGAVIKTMNGGEDWSISETPVNNLFLKTHSYNGQIVLVTGYDGIILRSSDEGETFVQVTSGVGSGYDLWGVQMLNDTLGFVCGLNQTLLKTIDGGLTWQPVSTGLNQHYWSLNFLNERYGMIVCSGGKILKTTDGGNNWIQIQAGDTRSLYTIDVIDSLHIAAAGADGKNVYSSNGGTTWVSNADIPVFSATNCIDFVDADTGYTVQDVYNIRKTINRGQSWFGLPINMTSEWHIQLLNDGTGYSCGEEVGGSYALNFFKRTNGLENWSSLFLNNNWSDVFFVNELKGFFIAYIGGEVLFRTEDGGMTYQKVDNALGGGDLFFLDSLTGFIGSNLIYKTTNGGETWYATQGSGGAGKIFFINSTTGWAVRSNVIYKTTDVGENWYNQLTLPTGSFTSIHFTDTLSGWTSILGKRPFKTTDGGNNWIEQTNLDLWQSRDVYFRDSLNGFILESNKLYKSSDAGIIWTLNPDVTGFSVAAKFGYYGNDFIFISGYTTYRTTNAGEAWYEFIELNGKRINGLSLLNEGQGYSAGEYGLILKYYDSTYVPVELISFRGEAINYKVLLSWVTASEINNIGFEIEKSRFGNELWEIIGFVQGNGTTTKEHNYSFTDIIEKPGSYYYRLKQLDYNGKYNYSEIIQVNVYSPDQYYLFQNYPNPFNNSTIITYQIPSTEFVTLKIYDVVGNGVKILIGENKESGYYSVTFSANDLSSGIYFYELTAGDFRSVKKLILIK